MDELRFLAQQSPRTETPMNTLVSPPRNGNRLSQPNSHDPRTILPRRFTTESGRVPTLSSIITTPQRVPEPASDFGTRQKVHLIEKKKQEYERLLSQKRRFEFEMEKLDQAQRREEQELAQMQEDLAYGTGHQSEPTTPPEYRETTTGFPTLLSRPNRYSTSSILSTPGPGLFARGASGGPVASPQATAMAQTRFALDDQLPLRAQPSRRDSDDDDKELAVRQDPTSHRSTNHLNRYSMPVTRSRTGFYDLASLDQTNTTRFLFGDDENNPSEQQYALAQAAQDESYPTSSRNELERHPSVSSVTGAPASTTGSEMNSSRPASIRHSLDLMPYQDSMAEAAAVNSVNTPPKLQPSFSANDIPTVKSNSAAIINNHAQQHLHNHNASIGRIPVGAIQARHNRDLSADVNTAPGGRDQAAAYGSIGSALQGNATNFSTTAHGAMVQQQAASGPPVNAAGHYTGMPQGFSQGPMAGSASAFPQLSMNMANMQITSPSYSQGSYGSYIHSSSSSNYATSPAQASVSSQQRDSQQRVIQTRRALDSSESMARFHGKSVVDFAGKMYETCKDQYGCRFLQRELELRKPAEIHAIWLETHQHVVELMMDPFGNYLCQKLLECCTEEERTALVENASRDMVCIALNQHGTRALQKMIEHVHTPEQVQMVTNALRNKVVDLIQDLNGNHVIQKCLNKLTSEQAGFIFKAVGRNCVEVGTHRHGCCVLQRCIDHASGAHKTWLIDCIIQNSASLITDPFGNYVVQYIIDLDEPTFTEQLILMFVGHIVAFSKHKFASNVMEKCIRCAPKSTKDVIITEILNSGEMDRILKDSYANYVVQTALDYAAPDMKVKLVQTIRPLLQSIRNTPYGRRIATKVNSVEQQAQSPHPLHPNGQIVRVDANGGQVALRPLAPGTNRSVMFSQPMDDSIGINGSHAMAQMAENVQAQPPQYNMAQGGGQGGGGVMRPQMMQGAPQHMMAYQMPPMGQMGQMGQMSQMSQMSKMSKMSQMSQMNQMGQMGQMSQMGQIGQMGQLSQLGQLSQMVHMGQGQMPLGQMGPMAHHQQQIQPRQAHTPVPRGGAQVRYPNPSGRPTPPMDGESDWV